MYKIIGADQKEYSSVTADQLRQWIADGRLNGQTPAQLEGETEWKTLSDFPEFAEVLGLGAAAATPPPLAVQADGREAALRRVRAPAIALMVTAILNLLLAAWGLFGTLLMHPDLHQFNSEMQQLNNPQMEQFMQQMMRVTYGPLGIASNVIGLLISALILFGVSRMLSLRNYEFAITATILSMVPCVTPCCLIGLPFGIWALVVLRAPEVKGHFH